VYTELEVAQRSLSELQVQFSPLQAEINQLTRQFWVTKEQVKANKYDLSASRYRFVEQDVAFYESPEVTMERLLELEKVMENEIIGLRELTR
jgi:type I restriction enzyme M protein